MSKVAGLLAFFMIPAVGTAQPLKYVIGLPIARGVSPTDGPWLLALWPDEGCKDCKLTTDDTEAYIAARNILVSSELEPRPLLEARFFVLKGKSSVKDADLASIREVMKKCKIDAEGVMRRPERAGLGQSFAIQFNCTGRSASSYMSLNFKSQKLVSVYWLPDGPIPVILSNG